MDDPICQGIYKIGHEYGANTDVPKYNPSDFGDDKLVLFTTIDIDDKSGVFSFKMHKEGTQEQKDANAIKSFFESKLFPPKYNWFDLKGCCLKNGLNGGKKIFDEVCFSMIFGFLHFRYMTMIKYVDRSFSEAMQNQEYVMGEIPLTDAQIAEKTKRKISNPSKLTISEELIKVKIPRIVVKGGRRTVIDEDTHDFLNSEYFKREKNFIFALKDRLGKGCAISYVIPIICHSVIRICPFFYDFNFEQFVPNAKEIEDSDPKSKTAKFQNDPNYYAFQCLQEGYFLSCSTKENYIDQVFNPHFKNEDEKIGDVPQNIRRISIKVYYFGSVTATSDLDFTVVTFHTNMVKNYHMQRMILDNFNHRYQNDMTVMQENVPNLCSTTGDCLDTNAYMTGFMDMKLTQGALTGINDIDDIFRNQDKQVMSEFNEISFRSSCALGMMALVQFWNEMEHENVSTELELKYNVNYQEGIISELKEFAFDSFFFSPLIQSTFDLLIISEDLPKIELGDQLENYSLYVADGMSKFSAGVHEDIRIIRTIQNNLDGEIGIVPGISRFEKSVKLNEGYTLLNMDSVEEVTHIQPDIGVALDLYKKFILKSGTALMYANEAYFNNGGIKYQTKKKTVVAPCSTVLEAAFMIMGYDLLHFYDMYPNTAAPPPGSPETGDYSLFNHGDSLLKLAKYFQRVLDIILNPCYLKMKQKPVNVFNIDFQELGYVVDTADGLDEVGEGYNGPSPLKPTDEGEKIPQVDKQVQNFRVLTLFANMAMTLKKKYGQTPLDLYGKVIILERNVLSYFEGYVISKRNESIGALAQLSSFLLNSMTFNFYLMQKIWENYSLKLPSSSSTPVGKLRSIFKRKRKHQMHFEKGIKVKSTTLARKRQKKSELRRKK